LVHSWKYQIARSIREAARDVARRIAATPEYLRSRHQRKKVEMLFAHLKRILKNRLFNSIGQKQSIEADR
jgi:hypothetical protein